MSGRSAFGLGLAYGVGLGVALRGLLDWFEATAHRAQPKPRPVAVRLDTPRRSTT